MTDDETTVSGTTIEPHWRVVSADVIEIGEVLTTVGDRDAEIFDGLAITHHGGPGVVHLTVAASDAHAARARRPRERRDRAGDGVPQGPHRDRHRTLDGRGQDLLRRACVSRILRRRSPN